MPNEDTRQAVFMMSSKIESIEEVAEALLKRTEREAFEALQQQERGRIEKDVKYFFNELTHIVLSWIAAGHIGHLKRLIPALDRVRFECSEEPYFLEDAPVNRGITARLDMLTYTIRVLLNMDGPAKYLGQISGQRRTAWRDLLVAMLDHGLPVRKNEALAMVPAFNDKGAVYHALEKMAEMGLIERQKEEGKKAVLYSLTWPGQGVATTLRDLHAVAAGKDEALPLRQLDEFLEMLWAQTGEKEAPTPKEPREPIEKAPYWLEQNPGSVPEKVVLQSAEQEAA